MRKKKKQESTRKKNHEIWGEIYFMGFHLGNQKLTKVCKELHCIFTNKPGDNATKKQQKQQYVLIWTLTSRQRKGSVTRCKYDLTRIDPAI